MRFYSHIVFGVLALLAAAMPLRPCLAQVGHDELKGFWQKGDARNWDREVNPNSSVAVSYHNYPSVVDKVKEQEAERQKLLAQQKQQKSAENQANPAEAREVTKDPQSAQETPPPASTPLSRDEILAKFGAPDAPQLIRAQKDSPPAMQGLFEALNSGDKELAWQYAVALARRQAEMQNVVSKATDYQMLAMEAIGIRPPSQLPDNGEAVDPTRAELNEFIERTRQQELQKRVVIDPSSLGEEGLSEQALSEQALGAQGIPVADPRARNARAALKTPQIPIDPEGKVKVLIFFDEKSKDSKEMAEAIRPLRERLKGDPNVAVLGLTKRTYTQAGLKLRGAELSFPFPLLSGEALALELRIQSYPTFVFLAVSTKQTYRIEGVPSLEEIERTVRVMKGGRG
jgi:hypothetical protein